MLCEIFIIADPSDRSLSFASDVPSEGAEIVPKDVELALIKKLSALTLPSLFVQVKVILFSVAVEVKFEIWFDGSSFKVVVSSVRPKE